VRSSPIEGTAFARYRLLLRQPSLEILIGGTPPGESVPAHSIWRRCDARASFQAIVSTGIFNTLPVGIGAGIVGRRRPLVERPHNPADCDGRPDSTLHGVVFHKMKMAPLPVRGVQLRQSWRDWAHDTASASPTRTPGDGAWDESVRIDSATGADKGEAVPRGTLARAPVAGAPLPVRVERRQGSPSQR
jgi:hypothetical protein